jgi:hypothetical protein
MQRLFILLKILRILSPGCLQAGHEETGTNG